MAHGLCRAFQPVRSDTRMTVWPPTFYQWDQCCCSNFFPWKRLQHRLRSFINSVDQNLEAFQTMKYPSFTAITSITTPTDSNMHRPDVLLGTRERGLVVGGSFVCCLWINSVFDVRPCIEPSWPTELWLKDKLFTSHHTMKFSSVCC